MLPEGITAAAVAAGVPPEQAASVVAPVSRVLTPAIALYRQRRRHPDACANLNGNLRHAELMSEAAFVTARICEHHTYCWLYFRHSRRHCCHAPPQVLSNTGFSAPLPGMGALPGMGGLPGAPGMGTIPGMAGMSGKQRCQHI